MGGCIGREKSLLLVMLMLMLMLAGVRVSDVVLLRREARWVLGRVYSVNERVRDAD